MNTKYNNEQDMELRTEKLRSLRNDYMIYNQQFDPIKRITLLDWIMDVCNSLGFKRSTYYLSVVLFDLFEKSNLESTNTTTSPS